MFKSYATASKHVEAAESAAQIIERSLQKCKKYPITREDDWSMTRALEALREVKPVQAAK